MIKFKWKASQRLLTHLIKFNSVSVWDNYTSNERCALHELLTEGFIVVYYDKTNKAKTVKLTDKGLQEIFIDKL